MSLRLHLLISKCGDARAPSSCNLRVHRRELELQSCISGPVKHLPSRFSLHVVADQIASTILNFIGELHWKGLESYIG